MSDTPKYLRKLIGEPSANYKICIAQIRETMDGRLVFNPDSNRYEFPFSAAATSASTRADPVKAGVSESHSENETSPAPIVSRDNHEQP